jgi:hypothetical protein
MTDWGDLPDEMRRSGLDRDTIERMLAGRIEPDDAPPGYSEVARVLTAAADTTDDREALVHEAKHVALAMAALTDGSPASHLSNGRSDDVKSIDVKRKDVKRKDVKWRSRRLKVGGLVVVGALVGSTGLAAAGVLPDAAQDAFSNVLDRVGISVPASGDHPASSGEEISEIATTTDSTGVDKGAEISSVASGGVSQAGEHGPGSPGAAGEGADGAQVTEPNAKGMATADLASQGASEEGTGHSG